MSEQSSTPISAEVADLLAQGDLLQQQEAQKTSEAAHAEAVAQVEFSVAVTDFLATVLPGAAMPFVTYERETSTTTLVTVTLPQCSPICFALSTNDDDRPANFVLWAYDSRHRNSGYRVFLYVANRKPASADDVYVTDTRGFASFAAAVGFAHANYTAWQEALVATSHKFAAMQQEAETQARLFPAVDDIAAALYEAQIALDGVDIPNVDPIAFAQAQATVAIGRALLAIKYQLRHG